MSDRFARRRAQLATVIESEAIDALLVLSEPNVAYLTGFTGDSSALLLLGDRALVISDGRYAEQFARECPGLDVHIRPVGQSMVPGIADRLEALGVRRVGFEATHLSVADFEELKSGRPAVEFKAVSGHVEALRTTKDLEEVAAIRRAIAIAEEAFACVRSGMRPEHTEKDIADRIEYELRRCGAAGSAFPPIVAAGANAALPHYRPSAGTRLDAGDFVLIDWGAALPGLPYKSDLTRVLVTGMVTPEFEAVYRTALTAQARACAAIRPGVQAGAVDAAARAVIDEAGFGLFFTHGLGHGVGIEIHEAPRLRTDAVTPLQPGMILTIEPGIYLPGWGGVRIEDVVLVTPDGCEVLTHEPRELESIRI